MNFRHNLPNSKHSKTTRALLLEGVFWREHEPYCREYGALYFPERGVGGKMS